jgi:protein-S-isoprenylcysteine O-methyltransferase Ste14
MSFPIGLLLIPYAIMVLLFLLLAIMNVYHLVRYSATSRTSFLFTLIFMAGTIIIAFISWQALGNVDWSAGISLNPFGGSPSDLPRL